MNTHKDKCRYKDPDKLLYAFMEFGAHKILISAQELPLFEQYLAYAKHDDIELNIDYEQSDNLPYKIVYGGLLLGYEYDNLTEKLNNYINDLKGYALLDISEERVNVSGYDDIVLYKEDALTNTFIPFAALMQTPHNLANEAVSITLFPADQKYKVWEALVNRPFLLACRETVYHPQLTLENWKDFISKDDLMRAYKVADLVTD